MGKNKDREARNKETNEWRERKEMGYSKRKENKEGRIEERKGK